MLSLCLFLFRRQCIDEGNMQWDVQRKNCSIISRLHKSNQERKQMEMFG